ncbi:MAG: hypothetical protein JW703_03960 [Candidatus Diapherotrites archaeon]|nr:hypothetical protein [Candidatus Diapherotrites archaeon]
MAKKVCLRANKTHGINPFAAGASAKVFKKNLFPEHHCFRKECCKIRGNTVRLSFDSKNVTRRFFYENKIFRSFFPENVLDFRAAVFSTPMRPAELHSIEVKANPELSRYMKKMTDRLAHDFENADFEAHRKKVESNPAVWKIIEKMDSMGIFSGALSKIRMRENVSNVSIANPEKPVFFEPYIVDVPKFIEFINETKEINESKKDCFFLFLKKHTLKKLWIILKLKENFLLKKRKNFYL